MTSGDHNLIPSERGELARSGDEAHPILAEMAGDLLASVKQKDELAPARPKDELAQPKGELAPQGSRIGDPENMFYETSTGEKFHHIFFREPLFWISFSSVNEWDCELAAKVKAVGAASVPEFCRFLTLTEFCLFLTLRERDRGLSSNFEYRLPTEDEGSKAISWQNGAHYKGSLLPDLSVDYPFRIILARTPKSDESARLAK